ncbi:MAG: hypothetical protein KAI79_14470 [Bacteroidales bacterium]|nr:hypothetical protein [Bacteroidales bacterium]
MKVSFTVDTNEDGLESVEDLTHATDYRIAISEIKDLLRNKWKYEEHSEEIYEFLECLRDEVLDVINNRISVEV